MSRRRYYRRRYRGYNNRYSESPLDMLIEMIVVLIAFTVKTFWNLGKEIVSAISQRKVVIIPPPKPAFVIKVPEDIAEENLNENSQPLVATIETEERKYDLKGSLLTSTEKAFYSVLKQVTPRQYQILMQVPLSGILKVKHSGYGFTDYGDFSKINKKTIDFVIYDQEMRACLAIELDDYTHKRWGRIKRDRFVNKTMEEVGLPLLRIPVSTIYDSASLQIQISDVLNQKD